MGQTEECKCSFRCNLSRSIGIAHLYVLFLVHLCFLCLCGSIIACNDRSNPALHQSSSSAICLSVNPTTETILSTPCDGFEHVFSSILKKRQVINPDTLKLISAELSNLQFDTSNRELDIRGKLHLYSKSDTIVICFDIFGNVLVNNKLVSTEKEFYKLLVNIAGWSEYFDRLKK